MPRYVAFLRAINVGGHTVKMDRLRVLFEDLRLKNVETFIASGNVLFDTSAKDIGALERKIEKHLEQALGYEVTTFVRAMTDLAGVVAGHPSPTSSRRAIRYRLASSSTSWARTRWTSSRASEPKPTTSICMAERRTGSAAER